MRTLARWWRRCAPGLFVILLLAGCVQPQQDLAHYPLFTCDSLTEPYWQEFNFGVESDDTWEDIVARIIELWDLDKSHLKLEESDTGANAWWQVVFPDGADPRYRALYNKELRLTTIFFMWWNRKPTLTQIIDCLGLPEFYAAYYERGGAETYTLNLTLWYVNKGFVVHGYSFHHEEQPPSIEPEYRMQHFNATLPGDLEGMISKLHIPATHAFFLCANRPWPGSIEEIEVESYLGADARCN